jgi:hypothetical protein
MIIRSPWGSADERKFKEKWKHRRVQGGVQMTETSRGNENTQKRLKWE